MWKKLFGYFAHLLTVAEATRENKAEIVQMRSELRDLALSVQLLHTTSGTTWQHLRCDWRTNY